MKETATDAEEVHMNREEDTIVAVEDIIETEEDMTSHVDTVEIGKDGMNILPGLH